jgi:hypothetical protein
MNYNPLSSPLAYILERKPFIWEYLILLLGFLVVMDCFFNGGGTIKYIVRYIMKIVA